MKIYRRPQAHRIVEHHHPQGTFVLAKPLVRGSVRFLGRLVARIIRTRDGIEIRKFWG